MSLMAALFFARTSMNRAAYREPGVAALHPVF
jgi:hypothetical protein